MKKLIILFAALILTHTQSHAGEIYWQTQENIFELRQGCTINAHSHNDASQISEFWLDCEDNNVPSIQTGAVFGRSIIYFAGEPKLICKVDVSQFGRNDDFFMLLDCQQSNIGKK